MVRQSVDLPQPDSPTRPSVSPGRDVEADVVDRPHRADLAVDQQPRLDREVLDEVVDLEQVLAVLRRRPGPSRGGRVGLSRSCAGPPARCRPRRPAGLLLLGSSSSGPRWPGASATRPRAPGTSVQRPKACGQRGGSAQPSRRVEQRRRLALDLRQAVRSAAGRAGVSEPSRPQV